MQRKGLVALVASLAALTASTGTLASWRHCDDYHYLLVVGQPSVDVVRRGKPRLDGLKLKQDIPLEQRFSVAGNDYHVATDEHSYGSTVIVSAARGSLYALDVRRVSVPASTPPGCFAHRKFGLAMQVTWLRSDRCGEPLLIFDVSEAGSIQIAFGEKLAGRYCVRDGT
jgi:hypothetical protein